MNYSIILLGATISVSLFIRICVVCGAIEVHSFSSSIPDSLISSPELWDISGHNDVVYGWLIGDPMFHYKHELKKAMLTSSDQDLNESGLDFDGTTGYLDQMIEKMASDLQQFHTKGKQKRRNLPLDVGDSSFEHQICGSPVRNESQSDYDDYHDDMLEMGEVPAGCIFVNLERTHLACNDTQLMSVPPLPLQLTTLDLELTQIRKVRDNDFGNVSIKHIRLYHNDITLIDPWAFQTVKNLTTLQIIDNELQYLSFDIYFGLTEVITLLLDGNNISFDIYRNCSIRPVEDIKPVLPKLAYFSLKGNPLKVIPAQVWAGLRESPTVTLDLANCALEYIDAGAFKYLKNLRNLDLSQNPDLMPSLKVALEGLRNGSLTTLSLSDNNLRSIPTDALELVSDTLTTLDLSFNSFQSITEDNFALSRMKKLEDLNLCSCKIQLLASGTIELIPELKTLNLSNNDLKEIPPPIYSLFKLELLSLDNNPQSSSEVGHGNVNPTFVIPANAFANLTSLHYLWMRNVPLKTIYNTSFAGLLELQYLFLDSTEVTSIEDLSFKDLRNVNSITLSNNPISSINSLTFYGMESLQNLYMQNCNLNFPLPDPDEFCDTTTESGIKNGSENLTLGNGNPYTPFAHLPSLQRVNFTNNKIEHLYPYIFNGTSKLSVLDLSNNNIQSWSTPIFQQKFLSNDTRTKYRAIDLSNNNLNLITDAMLQDMLDFFVSTVDLSDNQFVCDEGACNLRRLVEPPPDPIMNYVFPSNIDWKDLTTYNCIDLDTNQLYKITNVTEQVCKTVDKELPSDSPSSFDQTPSSSSSIITIAISLVCVTGFIAAALITGYKKRVHLKYIWFKFNFNIRKTPRSPKISTVEGISYDYDIFISYHNSDRDFIQDDFLPEVEEYSEGKATDLEQGNPKGFRVCLHERDFEVGVPITDNIVDSVDRSKKVVIVVSKNYLASQWCTFEMNLAYHRLVEFRRNSLVLIFLEEIPIELRTKVLNYLMMSKTYLEWPGVKAPENEKKRFWTRLRNSLSTSV